PWRRRIRPGRRAGDARAGGGRACRPRAVPQGRPAGRRADRADLGQRARADEVDGRAGLMLRSMLRDLLAHRGRLAMTLFAVAATVASWVVTESIADTLAGR